MEGDPRTARIVGRVWRTLGHVNFPETADQETAERLPGFSRSPAAEKRLPHEPGPLLEAIRRDPTDSAPWMGLGGMLVETRLYREAIPFLTQAIRVDWQMCRHVLA